MIDEHAENKPALTVLLAAPRGFCAGVDRAIQIVEKALEKYGAPVYVRHEIVHNRFVVDNLREKGAVFVEELDEIPQEHRQRPVIFSAHGVPKAVPESAEAQNIFYIDATCPLVSKVHREAERHHAKGKQLILIGHKGHPEVVGTMGQLPEGAVLLVETVAEAQTLEIDDPENLAYCTQTTLSVEDTADIIDTLKQRFPAIEGPGREDICYATTNRQAAVREIAPKCDLLWVIGAPNSSNSNRLVEVAKQYGSRDACLINRADEIDWSEIGDVATIGVTAGASAPDILIDEVIEALNARYNVSLRTVTTVEENVTFNIPRVLREKESA